jgi:hypothetical protein
VLVRVDGGVKPVMQSIVGDGIDGRPMGDCIRACIASIFELPIEEVPHFAESPRGWFRSLQDWLRPMGLVMEHDEHQPVDAPPSYHYGWWMASVESENFEGGTHAVVMRGLLNPGEGMAHEVAHDPSPHPRRTPYRFVGARYFVALDPAVIARRAQ